MGEQRAIPALHREAFGSHGPVVVFLHGLGATLRYWKPEVLRLQTEARVVLVDLLGFGDSPKPWRRYRLDRHLEALAHTLAPYPQIILVGHSLGASLAVAYAARHPQQVRAVVLMSMVCFDGERAAYRSLRQRLGLEGWIMTNVVATALACMLTRWVVARLLPWVIRDIPRPIVQDLVRHTWLSSTTTLWEVIYRYDPAVDLARVAKRIPVTLIHAINDRTAPYENITDLAADLPGCALRTLYDADHHVWIRQPEACLEHIAEAMAGANIGAALESSSQT